MKIETDTVEALYPGQEKYILKLLDDEDPRVVMREMGKMIFSSRDVLPSRNLDLLVLMLSTADFSYKDNEPVVIAGIIVKYIRDKGIPPYYIDYLEKVSREPLRDEPFNIRGYRPSMRHLSLEQLSDFGSKCFIGLAFFYDAMDSRYKRRNAPKPEYYRDIGITAFNMAEMDDIADNFENWETFTRDNLNRSRTELH